MGTYMEILKFEHLAGAKKFVGRLMQDKEYATAIGSEIQSWQVPATHKLTVWNSIE